MHKYAEVGKDENRNAQNMVVKTFLRSVQVHARPKESIKKRFDREISPRVLKILRNLASRTGVEPVSPP